ncbi:MAG: zf-HC2 domain-containing protein [Planctomycetes bacterium]|nr:zf-HC2 domain-containing protein [Planctomycetota bacterium]
MMLTCRQIAELLYEYLAGEMPAERAHELEMHLTGCVDCYRYLDQYRKVIALGQKLPPEPMPDELVRRLRSMVGGA